MDINLLLILICQMAAVVNGHKTAADTDSLDGGTGKMCLGRGMHCLSASIFFCLCVWLSVCKQLCK